MRKLLLVAALVALASPATAQPANDTVRQGLAENAFQNFWQRYSPVIDLFEKGDWELGCSLLRQSNTWLVNYFTELQAARPTVDWFEVRSNTKGLMDNSCTPRGY